MSLLDEGKEKRAAQSRSASILTQAYGRKSSPEGASVGTVAFSMFLGLSFYS